MRIVIPFDSSHASENRYLGGMSIEFYGGSERILQTVTRPRTYRLRSLVILTAGFNLVRLERQGVDLIQDFTYAPTSDVVGIELPMPEWTVELGQILHASFFNATASSRSFGGYFIGDV